MPKIKDNILNIALVLVAIILLFLVVCIIVLTAAPDSNACSAIETATLNLMARFS